MNGFLMANPGYRANLVDQLFAPTVDAKEAAHNLADLVAIATGAGLTSTEGSRVTSRMVDDINSGTAAADRALLLLQALLAKAGRMVEPFALPLVPRLLQLHADRSNAARDLATSLCATLAGLLSPHTFRALWPMLTAGMVDDDWRVKCAALQMLKAAAPRMSRQLSPLLPDIIPAVSVCIADAKKQVQTLALEALNEACQAITNDDIRHLTPMLVSVIAKPEESEKTLNKLLETTFVSNVDSATLALIAPLLGKVLRNRNTSQLKRKAARVIDNMCRLVREPADVAPFMPLLLPALEKMIDEIVDEEVCSVAKTARGILLKAFGEANATAMSREASAATLEGAAIAATAIAVVEGNGAPPATSAVTSVVNPMNLDVQAVKAQLLKALHSVVPGAHQSALMSSATSDLSLEGLNIDEPADLPPPAPATASATGMTGAARTVCDYVASLAAHLVVYDSPSNPSMPLDTAYAAQWRWCLAMSDPSKWRDCVTHYTVALRARTGATASSSSADGASGGEGVEDAYGEALAAAFRAAALGDVPDASDEADEDGGNVCNIEFSLAFGGKILLHNARLRLGRGRRYGIMGKNGAGKTTLLTNIGSGNIEGMPPHLKMVYVQHDDRTPDNGLPLMDEIMAGKDIIEANVTRGEVEKALRDIQFTDAMLTSPRSCLSGGWKMKVLIIRAMLVRADILLLDEPTNHLDAASVAWLASYLQSASEVTCMIVSHDIPFLDIVITDVMHYESKKLVYYHGNMTHFVAIHPEAKYYYELVDSTLQFKFPIPERLDGVNSTTRAVLKMDNITYTYPGATVPQLTDVSVKVCLASRIAVLGANGAGKSTMIRLLVQESEPDPGSGEVWKHHNLRVAYVAQVRVCVRGSGWAGLGWIARSACPTDYLLFSLPAALVPPHRGAPGRVASGLHEVAVRRRRRQGGPGAAVDEAHGGGGSRGQDPAKAVRRRGQGGGAAEEWQVARVRVHVDRAGGEVGGPSAQEFGQDDGGEQVHPTRADDRVGADQARPAVRRAHRGGQRRPRPAATHHRRDPRPLGRLWPRGRVRHARKHPAHVWWAKGEVGAGGRDVEPPTRAGAGRPAQLPGPRSLGRADPSDQVLPRRRGHHLAQLRVHRGAVHGVVAGQGRQVHRRGRGRGGGAQGACCVIVSRATGVSASLFGIPCDPYPPTPTSPTSHTSPMPTCHSQLPTPLLLTRRQARGCDGEMPAGPTHHGPPPRPRAVDAVGAAGTSWIGG